MANYTIIGGDGKQYGPITTDDLHNWIAEGRLNAQSQAKAESDVEFRALSTFPEFADALKIQTATVETSMPPAVSGDWLERDYELDIGGCVSRGWELVKNNFSVLFVGTLIYILIEAAIGGLARIPLIGGLFSVANLFIAGPLMAGVLYISIQAIRQQQPDVGGVFAGFRRSYWQLFLGTLVQGLLIGVCMIPFLIVLIWKFVPLAGQFQTLQRGVPPNAETLAVIKSVLLTSLPIFFVCLIPVTYLVVSWKFTLPLIIDRGMNFWAAMGASRKMVHKHWWHVFGLLVVIGLLNLAGFCVCCVGLLFTIPVGFAALMYAYETIFNAEKN
jgi:uncharacterized membrane protein